MGLKNGVGGNVYLGEHPESEKVTEELCGFKITTAQVSRAAALIQWRERPLGLIWYLIADAIYLKICHWGRAIDEAVLMATRVDVLGKRQVLGLSVSLSEAELHFSNA